MNEPPSRPDRRIPGFLIILVLVLILLASAILLWITSPRGSG